jgi:hypothetical protein
LLHEHSSLHLERLEAVKVPRLIKLHNLVQHS